jgi:hypothetical protein
MRKHESSGWGKRVWDKNLIRVSKKKARRKSEKNL